MKLDLSGLLRDRFVRGTFFVTAANFGGALFNFLVHPILTRRLSIQAYGDFQALLSFVTILGVLATVINTTLIKEFSALVAARAGEFGALRRRAVKRFSLLGLAIFVLIVFFTGPLNVLFHISKSAILVIASVSFLYSFPLSVNRAALSAKQDFFALALSNFLDPFFRILFVILFVVVWQLGLIGAAWAIALNGLVGWLYAFRQVKKLALPPPAVDFEPRLRRFWRYSLMVLWFTVLAQFSYNFDMLFVKSVFSPEEAGLYGALLTVGRIIYFVGGAVPIVMFPVVAKLGQDCRRRHAVLVKSLALMAALSLPVYFVMFRWPELVLRIVVGAKYLSMAPYLPAFGLVMLALSLVSVLSSYFLALARRRSLLILTGAVILEIILLGAFHGSLMQVITSLGASFAAAAVALLCLACVEYRADRRLSESKVMSF